MTAPTPPTNGAAELRETVKDRVRDLALVASGFIQTPEKPHYQEKTVDAILEAIAAWGRTIESKLPEKITTPQHTEGKILCPKCGEESTYHSPVDVYGFNRAIDTTRALLKAEIEGLTNKERE